MKQRFACTAVAVVALVLAVAVQAFRPVVVMAQHETLRDRLRERREARGTTPKNSSGAQSVTISFQGRMRQYLLYVPVTANGSLVVAFHGGGETDSEQEQLSGFDAIADHEHFVVAYPQGIGHSWADGRGTTNADRQGVDDVGLAKAVVADIARTHAVDRSRVFATGPSNGGIFSNTLGCKAADTFVAIAPVIGAIATAVAPACHPSSPVAVIGIQGVADPVVSFNGGDVGGTLQGAAAGGAVQSSRATQELWRSLNGCGAAVSTSTLPVVVNDGTSVDKRAYSGCRASADVVWYEIQGGGHRWPPHHADGIKERFAGKELGKSSQNINASEVIWQFFAAHARRI